MKLIALFLLSITLCGCTTETKKIMVEHINGEVTKEVMAQTEEDEKFLIGADISEDSLAKDISSFEELTGKHDIYADEIYITERDKAEKFILEAYAAGKTPYIILKCQDNIRKERFEANIDEMAETIGKYQVPVFVEILENEYISDIDNEYYNYASEKLYEKNALVKRIWSIKVEDIMIADKYCADKDVDFICVNGYFESVEEANRFFEEKNEFFDLDKPIILRFGAVSFSSDNCTYTSDAACSIIIKVYEEAKNDFDIKGAVYMDKSNRISNKSAYSNYYITIDKKVTEAYKKSIS